jgi:integrase
MAGEQQRRAYGEGSVYYRADRDRWIASVLGPTGKPVTKSAKTEREALRLVRKLVSDKEAGKLHGTGRETVSQYLERWLTETVRLTTAPTTYIRYEIHVRRHITPHLGKVRVQDLKPHHVRTWQAQLTVGPATVRSVRSTLHVALQQAVSDGLVETNVVSAVRGPRVPKASRPVLRRTELVQLLTALRAHRYRVLYLLELGTGLRISECLGLTWADIDWGTGTLYLRHQLTRFPGRWELREFKSTNRGDALVPRVLLEELQAHRVAQAAARLARESWANDWGLVFTSAKGGPLHSSRVLADFLVLLSQAGLPRLHLHDLRHQAASELNAAGIDRETIARVLGHGNVQMTGHYIHDLPERRVDAADVMESILRLVATESDSVEYSVGTSVSPAAPRAMDA